MPIQLVMGKITVVRDGKASSGDDTVYTCRAEFDGATVSHSKQRGK